MTLKNIALLNKAESDFFQIFAIFIGSISSFTNGLLFSWTSPAIPQLLEDKETYNITLEQISYFTVFQPVGFVLACPIFAKLCDSLGRKYTLLLIVFPHVTALILNATARSIYVFYAARFIVGIGDACLFSTLPVYVAEIATPKVRGLWGNLMTFCTYFGQFAANIVGSYVSIPVTSYISLIFPVVFGSVFIFMPESPYYYLSKNRVDDARCSLQRLRRRQDVEEELTKLKSDIARQMSESGTWKDLFTIKSNRKALIAGIFLRMSQQLGGISAITMYTQYVFAKAGSSVSPRLSAIIFSGLCFLLNIIASFTLDRFGRRKSYFWSLLLSGVFLLCETVFFVIDDNHPMLTESPQIRSLPLVFMVFYVVAYSFGVGIIPTLMLGELFSASIKSKGLLALNFVFGVLVASSTKIFNVFDTNFGLYSSFLFFAVCCFISTVLSVYLVPETKGKTLEEIQQSLKGSK